MHDVHVDAIAHLIRPLGPPVQAFNFDFRLVRSAKTIEFPQKCILVVPRRHRHVPPKRGRTTAMHKMPIAASGTAHAIVTWWTMTLADGIKISTQPSETESERSLTLEIEVTLTQCLFPAYISIVPQSGSTRRIQKTGVSIGCPACKSWHRASSCESAPQASSTVGTTITAWAFSCKQPSQGKWTTSSPPSPPPARARFTNGQIDSNGAKFTIWTVGGTAKVHVGECKTRVQDLIAGCGICTCARTGCCRMRWQSS